MPPEGQNVREHVAEEHGATKEQSDASRLRRTQTGADEAAGIGLDRAETLPQEATTSARATSSGLALPCRMHEDPGQRGVPAPGMPPRC